MSIVKQEFTMPVVGVIFLSALGIVIFSHFSKADFGIIGFLSWIVVIVGIVYFLLWVIAQIVG